MKITIEENGYKMVIGEDIVDSESVRFSLRRDSIEVPCDCPVRCTAVHRKLAEAAEIRLFAKLAEAPQWEVVG